jgi:hypothetical protein
LNSETCSKKNYFRSKKVSKLQNVAELRAFTVFHESELTKFRRNFDEISCNFAKIW